MPKAQKSPSRRSPRIASLKASKVLPSLDIGASESKTAKKKKKKKKTKAPSTPSRRSPRIAAIAAADLPSLDIGSSKQAAKAARKAARAARRAAKEKAAEEKPKKIKKEKKKKRKSVEESEQPKKKRKKQESEKEPEKSSSSTGKYAAVPPPTFDPVVPASSPNTDDTSASPSPTPTPAEPAVLSPVEFRKANKIVVAGKEADGQAPYPTPDPFMTFGVVLAFPASVRNQLKAAFPFPTPIQAQSWPICLQGRDLLSVAKTGSGKTLAFLLPTFQAIHRLEALPPREAGNRPRFGAPPCAPLAVVLAPTRELAMQIHAEADKYGKAGRVRSAVVYGGESKWVQIRKLQNNRPQLVVATPGRLNDLCAMKKIVLDKVGVLVLDEADRMLDMGFEPQLKEIRGYMTEQLKGSDRPLPDSGKCDERSRQTLFFSATWPTSVQRVANEYLWNPISLRVENDHGQLTANDKIKQTTIVLAQGEKYSQLQKELEVLADIKNVKSIIFMKTKRDCDSVANEMWESGLNCDSIHGDKMQSQRTRILAKFKSGQVPFLFATDVAARGLDVKDITHVINYDFPTPKGASGIEDFVHRIGRTARGGAEGNAITFFTRDNRVHAGALCSLLRKAKQEVPPALEAMAKTSRGRSGGGRGGRRWGGGRGGSRRGGGGYRKKW